MQIVLMGDIKCMGEKIKCEGESEGLRGELKGTKAKEENQKFRGGIRGADSAKGEMKYMREKKKGEGVK